LRASPLAHLDRLLTCPKAQQLAERLLDALDWYGARPGETTLPDIYPRLVAEALRVWYCNSFDDRPGTAVGYRVDQPSNWGKSYPVLRRAFEKHLSSYGLIEEKPTDTLEEVLLAQLLLSKLPAEFQVPDIPADLPYAGSIVWVNFVHGVTLVQAAQPELFTQLTFQQLVDFPLKLSENASSDLLQLIALSRVEPAMQWARATGAMKRPPPGTDASQVAKDALSAQDTYTEKLKEATHQLNVDPPDRLKMAMEAVSKVFGHNAVQLFKYEYAATRHKRDVIKAPNVPPTPYAFYEVYAGEGFKHDKKWFISLDGKSSIKRWFGLSDENKVQSNSEQGLVINNRLAFPVGKQLPDIKSKFNEQFDQYLEKSKSAYDLLIRSLLVTLPWDERHVLADSDIQTFTLREETENVSAHLETPAHTLPLRARMGFVLQATPPAGAPRYYECLPRAGIIRRRMDISAKLLGGDLKNDYVEVTFMNIKQTYLAFRNKTLPFDWQAHKHGAVPKDGATCRAILDSFGEPLKRPTAPDLAAPAGLMLDSPRTRQIASFICEELFYYDKNSLYAAAWGKTQFDRDIAKPHWLHALKPFVPFWGSIEDLKSDDFGTRMLGVLGLIVDVVSFAVPLGKFAAGSIRLMATAGRVGIRSTLPSFGRLTGKLMTASLNNFNPGAIAPSVLGLARNTLLLAGRGLYRAGRGGVSAFRALNGSAAQYDLLKGLPQITEPGSWKPLSIGDELATFKSVDDVPVGKLTTADGPRYFLIDPIALKPYGPRLLMRRDELTPGRSTFAALDKTDQHVLVELPESARVRELMEVDGRMTLLIDDVPYRLDGDNLRRADLIEDSQRLKGIPCRMRRMVGPNVCQTRYVTRDPAPTPTIGSYDESKGWALWFGDSIYTRAPHRQPLKASAIAVHTSLQASLEFQKGIFGRIKVNIPVPNQQVADTFEEGAILIEAMDGSKSYIFTRLNAGDFYVAERLKGQSVLAPLTLRKATTLPNDLRTELTVVYTGSLNANNIARLYGIEAVERAIKTMDDIAIPIGGHTHPPDTLKWLKVDTSPGEAVLFDHSTRMIVSKLPEGATTWSRSKDAPEAFRLKTAEIFDTLFLSPTIAPKNANTALRINETMQKLQKLLPRHARARNARNIAYAEVTTVGGTREIYVSVSGAQGSTSHLPLFRHLGEDHVRIGETTYINIDYGQAFPKSSLEMTETGQLLAVPLTIKDIENYTPVMTTRPTSLDSESKLIKVIREKYPDPAEIRSVDVATTMPPCESCAVVIKEFGYDGGTEALKVLWN
jgi:hypothetical protein